jgi:hypothetical protein
MPIDSRAKAFIEANIEHYREVTSAVEGFEAEVESVLRSIWREFKEQLAAVGLRKEDPSFKTGDGDMFLKSSATGIEMGISLQCRHTDDSAGRFAVYSWVWVKDPNLRKSLDQSVAVPARPGLLFMNLNQVSHTLRRTWTSQRCRRLSTCFATVSGRCSNVCLDHRNSANRTAYQVRPEKVMSTFREGRLTIGRRLTTG